MAEEEEPNKNKKLYDHKEVTAIGNSWIICRSETYGGRIYYFNTSTGKAVWNLSETEIMKAQLHTMALSGQAGASIGDCPEPAEPPGDSPDCSMLPDTSKQTRIYNKQIINNQFAKPISVPPFVNPSCHCSSLNPVKVVPAVYNPDIWAVPPTHQVYLAPTGNPLASHVQHFCNQHIPLQSGGVPLSSRFQIINQLANNMPSPSQGIYKNCQKKFQNFTPQWNKMKAKRRNFQNNDLRDVISSRRKDFIKEEKDKYTWNTSKEQGNTSTSDTSEEANITEEELYPSDVDDEWLKANTSGDSQMIDTSPLWRVDWGDADPDFWFIVPTPGVLLNHGAFLSRLVNSDSRLRVLTPAAALRRLRARTAGTTPRLPRRARAAIRFATLQMYNVPAGLKNLQDGHIASCCLGLMRQNYHVILLMTDEEEAHSHVYEDIPAATVGELQRRLVPSRDITVTVLSHDTAPPDPTDTSKDTNSNSASVEPAQLNSSFQNNEAEINPEEIQKDQVTSSGKRTVNASVQTDFEFTLTPSIESVNSNKDHTLEIDPALKIDAGNSKGESKAAPRKIKLNRTQPPPKSEPAKKTTVKWRKRRAEPAKCDPDSNEKRTVFESPNVNDLLLQRNDNAVDLEKTETRETRNDEKGSNDGTVGVISNSIDSESMIRVNKKAILSQSGTEDDIHMFEVAGEEMEESLVRRRDEWLSRFVQAMEEALSQALRAARPAPPAPAAAPAAPAPAPLPPPPWSLPEAAQCVSAHFRHDAKIVSASDNLATVLHQISDSRGKINGNLSPTDFMRMYSYGVYLIKNLQDVLKDSEDLHIANMSLSKLLMDIRDPNLDVSHNTFIDSFNDDKLEETSNTDGGMIVSDDTMVCEPAPAQGAAGAAPSPRSSAKYSLRSSGEQRMEVERQSPQTNDDNFFTCLRLQRNTSATTSSTKTVGQHPPSLTHEQTEPKIIRHFNICADFEEKLKNRFKDFQDVDDEYFAEDDLYSGPGFLLEPAPGAPDVPDVPDVLDARAVLKWVMERTTYPVHRVLTEVHTFCTDTHDELNAKEPMEPGYFAKVSKKTVKVIMHMKNLCEYLDRVVRRAGTRGRLRRVLQELGFDAEVGAAPEAEYRAIVKKYLDQANILLEAVTLIATAVRHREFMDL